MRAPAQLWECRTGKVGDLAELRKAVRAYLDLPGARTMNDAPPVPHQAESPLERALGPKTATTVFRHL